MSDQQQKPGFFASFRAGSRRNCQEDSSPRASPPTSAADLDLYGHSSYGSLSTDNLDAEVGGIIAAAGASKDSLVVSPTSSEKSGSRPASIFSPLLGEGLLDTEDDRSLENEDTALLPIPPPKLHLPPTAPRRGKNLGSPAARPGKAYAELYQNAGPVSPRSNINNTAESPSSVSAQPGDWRAGGLGYGTENGGDKGINGDSSVKGSRTWFARIMRISVIVLLVLLAAAMATVLSIIGYRWIFRDEASEASSGGSMGYAAPLVVPYPSVDRSAYGDPAESIVDTDLFDPRLLGQIRESGVDDENSSTEQSNSTGRRQRRLEADHLVKDIQSSSTSLLKIPFPTGSFWTNLVLKPDDKGLSYPIFAYPYGYKWSPTTLLTSYPPLRRKVDEISIRDMFQPDLTFGSDEVVANRHVISFDPLSVSIRFLISDHKERSNYWESYIVRGSPYVTIKYRAATPIVKPLSTYKNVMCPRDDSGNYNNAPASTKAQLEANGNTTGSGKSGGGRRLDGGSWGICSSKTGGNGNSVSLTGVQFLLQTQENLTWLVFASSPITLLYDGAKRMEVKAAEPFTGVLRFALVPPPANDSGVTGTGSSTVHDGVQLSSSSAVKRLIYHASVYPVAGHISWDFQSSSSSTKSAGESISNALVGGVSDSIMKTNSKSAKVMFNFDYLSMSDSAQGSSSGRASVHDQLLMLALPHHTEVLGSDMLKGSEFDLNYHCIKGKMTPVVGDIWEYYETLPSIGFDDEEALHQLSAMDESVRRNILDQAKKDIVRVLPSFDENVYGFGKQVARLAQIVHISHKLSSASTTPDTNQTSNRASKGSAAYATPTFIDEGLGSLRKFLCTFLRNGQKDKLLFDAKFGGMVTEAGLADTNADFGNGRFNDHHFHYGYLLYASAILGLYDPHFVKDYGPYVDSLLYDVAYSSNAESGVGDDNFFPFTRHLNWYDGHSFASGLFPYANGKSQESSSEAVNCYYGAYLWSKVRFGDGTTALESATSNSRGGTDFARLLLAMEIRGAQTYWHMMPQTTALTVDNPALNVYNNKFAQNYMVGNLGMVDAVCSTWFGTNKLYVHMINFVPLTAITSVLFNQTYVSEEFKVLDKLAGGVEMAWKGYVVGDRAIIDPNGAWEAAQKLISYELDAALSLSQLLYFIATRKGFSSTASASSSTSEADSATSSTSDYSASACETHPICVDLGLSGECCPTSAGTTLGCCSISSRTNGAGRSEAPSSSTQNATDNGNTSSSACASHAACVEIGLIGQCCPTADGTTLGCCATSADSAASLADENAAPSSRPAVQPSAETKNNDSNTAIKAANEEMNVKCKAHPACTEVGLTGNCCPTDTGITLGCCGTASRD